MHLQPYANVYAAVLRMVPAAATDSLQEAEMEHVLEVKYVTAVQVAVAVKHAMILVSGA